VHRAIRCLPLGAGVVAIAITSRTAGPAGELPPASPQQDVVIQTGEDGMALADVIQHASESTRTPFLLAPSLESEVADRRVRISIPITVALEDLLDFFKAVLLVHNVVVYPIGPSHSRLHVATPFLSAGPAGGLRAAPRVVPADELHEWKERTGDFISTTIPLQHIDISRARQELGQLINKRMGGAVTNVSSTNALIVSDFAPTVRSIYEVLKQMDRPPMRQPLAFERISLKHAPAEAVLPLLVGLLGKRAAGMPLPEPRIVAEPRTNSILVYGLAEDLAEIRDLVKSGEHAARRRLRRKAAPCARTGERR
jgi:type II secretory pathway component GspD/PulD (secretin)